MTLAFTDIPSTSTRALPLRNPSHLAAWRHPLKNQLHIRQALMQPGSSNVALSKLPNLNIAEYPSLPTKMCSSTSPAMLASCIQTMHPVGRGILKLFTGNRMKTTWSDLFQLHPISNQMSFSDCGRAVWYFHSPSIHQRKSIQCPPSCQGFPFTKFRDYWAGFFQSLWKQLPIEVHDVFKLQGAQLMSQSFESNQIHLLVAQSCQGFASAAPELIRIVQSCADRIKMDQDGSSYVKFKSKAQLLRATSMGTMESSNPWHIKMGISHLSAASAAGIPEDSHPATEQMPAKV